MKFNTLIPMLWVPDVKESISFYTNILGFSCDKYSEEWQWATITRNCVELMFTAPNKHIPYNGPVFTGSFYIRVDDVDIFWNELKDKTDIVYPVDNFEYGMREFAIKDNNGFILQFGQPIKTLEIK